MFLKLTQRNYALFCAEDDRYDAVGAKARMMLLPVSLPMPAINFAGAVRLAGSTGLQNVATSILHCKKSAT